MKVYTKTGDEGTTGLYDGSRASKNEIFFDVLGELDELSSRVGMLCALFPQDLEDSNMMMSQFRKIQSTIQDINSIVGSVRMVVPFITKEQVNELEFNIDFMEEKNPKLTKFILPGVTPADAQAHLCRTQARKVERYLWELHNSEGKVVLKRGRKEEELNLSTIDIHENIMCYMNRLSDFFFVLARWVCSSQDIEDCFAN